MNNMNPWLIAAFVEYEQERIRQAMKQIRLEEAMRAGRTEEKPPTLASIVLAC